MRCHLPGIALSITIATSLVACGASAASPSPAGATTFDEYATAFCSAWGTLFRVVGNPDTGDVTDGVRQLQAAAEARDNATAERLQGEINTELEAGRQQIAYAAAWPPAARPMAEMDRVFLAFEKWAAAYVDVARGVPDAPDAQAALEAAGGIEAWQAMFEAYADVAPHRPDTVAQCPDAPITP